MTMTTLTRAQLARMIDHTILKPEATEQDVRRVIQEAAEYRFASVCTSGRWTELVAAQLLESNMDLHEEDWVLTCTVVGFPLGAGNLKAIAYEAECAVEEGADEIDMVIPIGDLLGKQYETVEAAIKKVRTTIDRVGNEVVLKVILETALLSETDIREACQICSVCGVDFVKTSTGFHPKGGATVQAVKWLGEYGAGMRVKASGGIRDLPTALSMLEAGADRLGCSASVAIVQAVPN